MRFVRKKTDGEKLVLRETPIQRGRVYLPLLGFPILERTGIVTAAFSTRMGGVSEGETATLNFSFQRDPDHRDRVMENYNRVSEALDADLSRFVFSYQTHTANIRLVTEEDAGKGLTKERDYKDVDGMITKVPGLLLTGFFADCVPVYFVDKRHRAVGLAHSGWRGTVQKICACMVKEMRENFGTRPEELVCAIGPSICRDCYEVSADVIEEFDQAFGERAGDFYDRKDNGKFQLDLWQAVAYTLTEAGVKKENIELPDICTCENPDLLFSHRASHGHRGNLCAFLMLNDTWERDML